MSGLYDLADIKIKKREPGTKGGGSHTAEGYQVLLNDVDISHLINHVEIELDVKCVPTATLTLLCEYVSVDLDGVCTFVIPELKEASKANKGKIRVRE